MPAWVRKTVNKVTKSITAGTNESLFTDPTLITEIAAADESKDYVAVETIGTNITIEVYRHEGALATMLERIDPLGTPVITIATTGVHGVIWPPPPAGAARQLELLLVCGLGTESVTVETDTTFRSVAAWPRPSWMRASTPSTR
ncbi:MAG TPA: hypothetical protein QGF58_14455 [Myxococcota bacterium]|nr:hypothetical protein [Myxococcota bacterium]